MSCVLDASAAVNFVADPFGQDFIEPTKFLELDFYSPDLLVPETLSILQKLILRNEVSEYRARQIFADVSALEIRLIPMMPLAQKVWKLRNNITPYDAMYVALAAELYCPLLTSDQRLHNAAQELGLQTL